MILMKLKEDYKLYSHDSCIATTHESPYKRLSKENCNEIFGVVDVEKLAEETIGELFFEVKALHIELFKKGFNKAMELIKDKLFTIKEVVELCKILLSNPIEKCGKTYQELTDNYIQSLQQQEIEVEIEMENYVKYVPKSLETIYPTGGIRPRLDENGCLILKKK